MGVTAPRGGGVGSLCPEGRGGVAALGGHCTRGVGVTTPRGGGVGSLHPEVQWRRQPASTSLPSSPLAVGGGCTADAPEPGELAASRQCKPSPPAQCVVQGSGRKDSGLSLTSHEQQTHAVQASGPVMC